VYNVPLEKSLIGIFDVLNNDFTIERCSWCSVVAITNSSLGNCSDIGMAHAGQTFNKNHL